jgi:hypothetical protein
VLDRVVSTPSRPCQHHEFALELELEPGAREEVAHMLFRAQPVRSGPLVLWVELWRSIPMLLLARGTTV